MCGRYAITMPPEAVRVVRYLACLLLIAIPVARADLDDLVSAAYIYRNELHSLKVADGDAHEAVKTLRALAAGDDQIAAEAQAESMVSAGYENYDLWIMLKVIKSRVGKPSEAVYAAYFATTFAKGAVQKAAAYLALGRALEQINRHREALEAYDEASEFSTDAAESGR